VISGASPALGSELRRIREAAGLSGSEVARSVGWSQPRLSRVETGRFSVSVGDVAALLDFYGVPEEIRAELLSMTAGDDEVPGAWIVRAGGPRRRQADVGDIEGRAVRLRQYQPAGVPGLLQTDAYARAFAAALGFDDATDIAARRALRRTGFHVRSDVRYEVVLDASVVDRWPGDRQVMAEQIRALLDQMERPMLDLRIQELRRSGEAFAMTGFLMYEFAPSVPDVVLVETRTTDLYLSAKSDVATYTHVFERLQADSLSASETRSHLEQALRRLSRGH
jgi:transcriptional regulator with XRE-family HTH domain